ncbi:MAG: excinuclease ABC subunit UvrA [Brevinematales bacterium]|nr:excinuclease ABC subunit UvrA [Brevinematales bacterium]
MDYIVIRGAREHNLKNIDLNIPKNKLVVITGLSGSGKSSLAFNTIYAEGERRYLESVSTYARQFLGRMNKPDVDKIEGLSPSISLEQSAGKFNPRSIVATVTEIYDYMRLLFARCGMPTCYVCGRELQKFSIDEIVSRIMNFEGNRVMILAPLVQHRKGTFKHTIEELINRGFTRFVIDGNFVDTDESGIPELEKNVKHNIDVVVDRIKISADSRGRIFDSVDIAVNLSDGSVIIELVDTKEMFFFSDKYMCPEHLVAYTKIEPNLFSFNSPVGACHVCGGLGENYEFDPDLVIPDKSLSILEGAIKPLGKHQFIYWDELRALAKKYNFSLDTPIKDLPPEIVNIILYGSDEEYRVIHSSSKSYWEYTNKWYGIITSLQRRYENVQDDDSREWFLQFMRGKLCGECNGDRLNKFALSVKFLGKNIMELTKLTASSLKEFFVSNQDRLNERIKTITTPIIKEILQRLNFLIDTGLDYITLDRKVSTLSGGELQRIRLATQLGSGLSGIIYVVDEPTIGLHQKDTERLINTLKGLRDLGNTVIVVEHDEDVILSSDYLIDLGPGAGSKGGEVVIAGELYKVIEDKQTKSLTIKYLRGEEKIPVPENRRQPRGFIKIYGLREHNLKNIDVKIPKGCLVCVTGVSGSGKSSFVIDTFYPAIHNRIYKTKVTEGKYDSIEGYEDISRVIMVDQTPIGRTPRSTPATYVGIFGEIRKLFALTKDARAKGYDPSRFSFNVKGGRCESCQGQGIIKVEMNFLPDVYVTCDVCNGTRYNSETLEVRFKGKNIYEVLEMTIDEAYKFFENERSISDKLRTFIDVGLGYLKLGQPATTLSGGEAQRVKIVEELSKKFPGHTLYILDEPTIGLHFDDVKKLVNSLQMLVDKGHTVVVIEHNLDLVKCADYIIDLGPEGGDRGGYIVAEGTPEDIMRNPNSYTGQYLKRHVQRNISSKITSL